MKYCWFLGLGRIRTYHPDENPPKYEIIFSQKNGLDGKYPINLVQVIKQFKKRQSQLIEKEIYSTQTEGGTVYKYIKKNVMKQYSTTCNCGETKKLDKKKLIYQIKFDWACYINNAPYNYSKDTEKTFFHVNIFKHIMFQIKNYPGHVVIDETKKKDEVEEDAEDEKDEEEQKDENKYYLIGHTDDYVTKFKNCRSYIVRSVDETKKVAYTSNDLKTHIPSIKLNVKFIFCFVLLYNQYFPKYLAFK